VSGLIVIGLVIAVLVLAHRLTETRTKLREAQQGWAEAADERDEAERERDEAERERNALAMVLAAHRAANSNGQLDSERRPA